MVDVKQKARTLIEFIQTDIWRVSLDDLAPLKRLLIKFTRIAVMSVRGFIDDNCTLRSSALTFFSLLSIVPVVAMAFGVAKGFGFEKLLEKEILERFAGQEEILHKVIAFSRNLLDDTRGGLVAGIGILVLIWSVMKVMGHIESSFNDIWEVDRARSIGRKLADYLAVMLIGPILILLSSSVTVYITTQITTITENVKLLGMVSPVIFFFLRLFPYTLIWLVFIILYLLIPNTRVNLVSSVIGGILAGTAFQLVQWGYIHFQVGIAKYNAIYGSFAALPLFLMWLHVSWLIVLFGAEIACSHQNVGKYGFDDSEFELSHRYWQLLSLQITHLVVKNFSEGEEPQTAAQISDILKTPLQLTRRSLNQLVRARILSPIREDPEQHPCFQPAFDIHRMSVQSVLEALETVGLDSLPAPDRMSWENLSRTLTAFSSLVYSAPENRLIKDIRG